MLLTVAPIKGFCVCSMFCCAFLCFLFCNYHDGEERAGCFILFVFLMSCFCYCSVALPHGAMGLSAVCDCCILQIIPFCFFSYIGQIKLSLISKKGLSKKIVHLNNSESLNQGITKSYFVLFDLILYVPSTIFQLNRNRSSWVEPVLS